MSNPATSEVIGHLPSAAPADVDAAIAAAHNAFLPWRHVSPVERSERLRQAATLARERASDIAYGITLDNGKPLPDAMAEVLNAAEHLDWHAEEDRRIYGRVVPPRDPAVRQVVVREPVGVCAAISLWNFPFGQAVKKVAAAMAAGCTVLRLQAVNDLVADAEQHGAAVLLGGKRIGEAGHFHAPTLLADVPGHARVMHEEPFGPVAALARFASIDDALRQANALPFGLASYVFTQSLRTATRVANGWRPAW